MFSPAACVQALSLVLKVALSWMQDLLEMLKQSAQVILPVLSDGNRELLRELEQAGIDYIGSPFEAGELASHKHR